jgi:predicted TIM-barrel fold metal-dependent hydrolase
MIIDSHVHTFPYMGSAAGFPSTEARLARLQAGVYRSINPHRRRSDHTPVTKQTLWNGKDLGPAGNTDVNFRVAKYGCFEWTADGEDLYIQYFAPSLMDQISSAEYMVAEMDYAGVDIGILQNHGTYGILNDFFADCVRQYPDRYIASAGIPEAEAHTDEQISELRRCAEQLGHKSLFYQVGGFWETGYRDHLDDAKFNPFWEEVRRLGLVVFWDPAFGPTPTVEDYNEQLKRMLTVMERYPGMPGIIPQAFPIGPYAPNGRYELPDIYFELAKHPDFTFEVCYPISYARKWEYPYRETWPLLHQLYDWFGPERLIWGSDMPNVNRFCSYRQSYEYVKGCDFLSPADLDLFLGGNLARLFKIDTASSTAKAVKQ